MENVRLEEKAERNEFDFYFENRIFESNEKFAIEFIQEISEKFTLRELIMYKHTLITSIDTLIHARLIQAEQSIAEKKEQVEEHHKNNDAIKEMLSGKRSDIPKGVR